MTIPSFLERDADITKYSGYHTHTVASYFLSLECEDDLMKLHEAYVFAQDNGLKFLIIGGGTNLLFANERFEGVVIKNMLSGWRYDEDEKILHTNSNESIWSIAESLENQYNNSLWHRFIGLPGSVGGAVFGNAGCFGLETESNFLSASVFDMKNGVRRNLTKEEMNFSYRHSMLKENEHLFLVGASFNLGIKQEKYHSDVDNIDFRNNKQPKGYSSGSFFKNPSKEYSAGFLVESVGLKGYHHGGAYWSDIHANFLMSDGLTCTGRDLVELMELTQIRIKKEKGIELVNEVRIIY